MEVKMRKGFLVGVGAALTLAAFSATDASACGERRACGGYYAPPVAYSYSYAPAPAYGYLPPGPAYGYAPPPVAYGPPVAGGYGYGFYGDAAYGGYRGCNRGYGYGYGYGYAPPAAYESYQPAAVWAPFR
jgi:hypothetical protein